MSDNPVLIALAQRAYDLLSDGKWHPAAPIRLELAKVIPPGVAVRKCEQARISAYRQHNPEARDLPDEDIPPRKRPLSRERQIESGRKVLISDFLHSTAFELFPRLPHGQPNPNQMIRQLHPHRSVNPLWKDDRIAELEAENAELRERLAAYEHAGASDEPRPDGPPADRGLAGDDHADGWPAGGRPTRVRLG